MHSHSNFSDNLDRQKKALPSYALPLTFHSCDEAAAISENVHPTPPVTFFFQLESRLDFPIYRFQMLRNFWRFLLSRFQFVVHSLSFKKKKPSDWNLRLTCEVPWKSLLKLNERLRESLRFLILNTI